MDWKVLILTVLSITIVVGLVILLKTIFYKFKRPNGKKGGLVSLHAALASSIVVLTVLITSILKLPSVPTYILISFSILMAYLIIKNKYDYKEHYIYQIVLGIIIGVIVPFGLNYAWEAMKKPTVTEERVYAPEGVKDDRREADVKAPELKIEPEENALPEGVEELEEEF